MASNPVAPGLFISTTWSTALSASAGPDGAYTVTRTAGGGARGIHVEGPGGSLFHATVSNNVSRYTVFGVGHYLLILESQTNAGPVHRSVSLVDFTGGAPVERSLYTGLARSTSVPLPTVQFSQGGGGVFLTFSSSGTEIHNTAIYRSDTGDLLCPGPPPFVPTGEVRGEVVGTDVIIHYTTAAGTNELSCPLPAS